MMNKTALEFRDLSVLQVLETSKLKRYLITGNTLLSVEMEANNANV